MTERAAAALGGLVALASLWMNWFQPDGEVIVLFGAFDRLMETLSPTAWEAFGWEDLVLAGLAAATLAVAAAGRWWFPVPLAGALFAGGVAVISGSREHFGNEIVPSGAGLVPVVALAVAAAALAAGRYRLRRR